MSYSLSIEQFNSTFAVKEKDEGTKLTHNSGKKFKLFPFIANNNIDPVMDLNGVIGRYLSKVEGNEPIPITVDELIDQLKEDTTIDPGMEEVFAEVVRNMFFDKEGRLRPINLRMLAQTPCVVNSEIKLADYLVDVLGDAAVLKNNIQKANKRLDEQSNVLERFAISKLSFKTVATKQEVQYYRITEALHKHFEEDFEYILGARNRTKDYLIPLLEFYYFTYTAQTCLQLNRFLEGERNQCIPLYFCLEWEKTSQSRKCFTEGWTYLQPTIKKIFAHAIVLEILNQSSDQTSQVDYIELKKLLVSDEEDQRIATEIRVLTDVYRNAIDCTAMHQLAREEESYETAAEVKYLFDSVKCQFENTDRIRPYSAYAAKFEEYSRKYLKRRGRSGMMLNLTEETLIFLTKICIKDQEKMRLNDVFKGFEARGVFLDNFSKEQVMYYYEKLNLIEKKSDSGDAQYVKRIL